MKKLYSSTQFCFVVFFSAAAGAAAVGAAAAAAAAADGAGCAANFRVLVG